MREDRESRYLGKLKAGLARTQEKPASSLKATSANAGKLKCFILPQKASIFNFIILCVSRGLKIRKCLIFTQIS